MDATALLTKQHRKVEKLFKKLSGKNPSHELVIELANELAGHMAIEQDVFYPTVRKVDEDLVLESYEEHALAEMALKRLLATDIDDEAFHARVTALKEVIEHHVHEEEEELFPKVDKALGEDRSRELAKHMKARFSEVVEAGFEAAVPRGMAKTSADVSKRHYKAAGKASRAA